MNVRAILYQAVRENEKFQQICEDRWGAATVAGTVPGKRPYAVYRMGIESVKGPAPIKARQRTLRVWVHDDPGSYDMVDAALDAIREALEEESTRPGHLEFRWIERSEDLHDPTLGTICRYDRWMAIGF